MGTPAYLAPEQLSGHPPAPASDLFGWACTMVFAATGRLAFPGDTVPAILMAIAAREPDLSAVPGPLRPLLAACLAKDPAARPTAAALLREVTGLRSPAHGDAPSTTAGPPVAASTWPSGLGTPDAVPSIPASGQATSLYTPGSTPAPPPAADPGGPRRRRWLVVGAPLAAVLAVAGIFLVMWVRSPEGSSNGTPRQAPVDGTLLYEDDFSERGGWDGYNYAPDAPDDQRTTRGYEVGRGVYTMLADGADATNTALSPVPAKEETADAPNDVQIAVTAEIRDVSAREGGIGLLCRWDENVPNGYAFRLGLDGTVRVSRTDQGTRRNIGPAARVSAPRPGTKTRLQAACRTDGSGTRLTFWVDGARAIEVVDPRSGFTDGIRQAGMNIMVVESGGGSLTVSFDDFTIHRLN
jgi:hypothetical protein